MRYCAFCRGYTQAQALDATTLDYRLRCTNCGDVRMVYVPVNNEQAVLLALRGVRQR